MLADNAHTPRTYCTLKTTLGTAGSCPVLAVTLGASALQWYSRALVNCPCAAARQSKIVLRATILGDRIVGDAAQLGGGRGGSLLPLRHCTAIPLVPPCSGMELLIPNGNERLDQSQGLGPSQQNALFIRPHTHQMFGHLRQHYFTYLS